VLTDIVHELQRERGSAAIYIASNGARFKDRLTMQIQQTDQTLDQFKQQNSLWKKQLVQKPSYSKKLTELLNKTKNLHVIRNSITNLGITLAQTFNFYSHQMIGPLLQIMIEIACFSKDYQPESVSAFNSFLQWKERVGLERGIGTRGFINETFLNDEFLERFSFVLSEQKNYKEIFLTLANHQQRDLLAPLEESPDIQKLYKYYDELKHNPDSKLLRKTTPEEWFDLLSQKIDILHDIEKKLIDNLDATAKVPKANSTSQPGGLFDKYRDFIISLQIFSNLPQDSMLQILNNSKIINFPKNKIIFQEGEKADKLFIVLKGWVKVYKSNPEGEETIVQMLSSGDTILEPFIFLNTVFSVSGQAIEDVIILSIPASVLNQQMQESNKLALNFISNMSHSSMHLVRQIKNIRLKKSDERIGWFLLKLHIEQGLSKKTVILPYKKNLMASYLGMTSETLSRGLNKLKQQGVKVLHNKVILPSTTSFCAYCDFEIAGKCDVYNSEICKYSKQPKVAS